MATIYLGLVFGNTPDPTTGQSATDYVIVTKSGDITGFRAFAMEFTLTFILVYVIFATAFDTGTFFKIGLFIIFFLILIFELILRSIILKNSFFPYEIYEISLVDTSNKIKVDEDIDDKQKTVANKSSKVGKHLTIYVSKGFFSYLFFFLVRIQYSIMLNISMKELY